MAETKDYAERNDAEMMSDGTMARLLEYLKSIGWSDSQIVELMAYIAKAK